MRNPGATARPTRDRSPGHGDHVDGGAERNAALAGARPARNGGRPQRDLPAGLRSDLRDAYSRPLWQDPSELLARRAIERRVRKQRTELTCVSQSRRQTALFGAPPMLCNPRADRSGRYLV